MEIDWNCINNANLFKSFPFICDENMGEMEYSIKLHVEWNILLYLRLGVEDSCTRGECQFIREKNTAFVHISQEIADSRMLQGISYVCISADNNCSYAYAFANAFPFLRILSL